MKRKWTPRRIFLWGLGGYLIANLAYFVFDPFSSPWHYYNHKPRPIEVVQAGDKSLSLAQISGTLDEIDLAYQGREPTKNEESTGSLEQALAAILFPGSMALNFKYFMGYMGPATREQQAFTLSVKKRYNHLARLAIAKGLKRDGYIFIENIRLKKQNGLSFQELRHRFENPDHPYLENKSFEEPRIGRASYTYIVPKWKVLARKPRSAFVQRIEGFSADVQQHLGMERGTSVAQDLDATYQPNSLYILRVWVGNRPRWTQKGNRSTIALTTDGGHPKFSQSLDASKIKVKTFRLLEVRVDTSKAVELRGHRIRVLLSADGQGRSHFDKVQLTWKQQ